jgi:hypothetical protein
MKLTKDQILNLVTNAKLGTVIQYRLGEAVRLMWHSQPVQLVATPTTPEQEIAEYNISVLAWKKSHKLEEFCKKYYPQIGLVGEAKQIFVNSLAQFDYANIDGLMSEPLVEVIAQTNHGNVLVIDFLIYQIFNKVMFPPQEITV